jgi:60 kDa SS-A/Ro ribonucleoprotein
MTALRNVNRKETAQTTRARADQVVNNAGGYVFAVDDKARLERFLILGTDGGTYYVGEKNLTEDAVNFVSKLIKNNERLVRETVVSVSEEGRAYRNSPALFTLALLFAEGKDKAATRAIFDKVVRTSTHLFEFSQYIENIGGWGRSKRNAVAEWILSKSDDQLAYQAVKYRSRTV